MQTQQLKGFDMAIPSSVENVTANAPDGAVMGKSATEKCGFWGATPVVQPAISAVGTTTATTTLNETKIDRLYAALITAGLINTSG